MSIVHSDSLQLTLLISYTCLFWQLSMRYSSFIFHSHILF